MGRPFPLHLARLRFSGKRLALTKGKGSQMADTDKWDGVDRRLEIEREAEKLRLLTADIVAAHVSNNSVAVNDLPQLIAQVHGALVGLAGPVTPEKPEPKVPIRQSIKPDFIVCLEDGKKLKMLKRHIMTHYGMTPEQYRQKWGLAADYPMVAPNYAEQRRTLAKSIGLGTKRRKTARK